MINIFKAINLTIAIHIPLVGFIFLLNSYANAENMNAPSSTGYLIPLTDHTTKFLPELQKTLERMPKLDPETGLYVEEIQAGLYYITDGVYQSAFLHTNKGVMVFDAPPSFAEKLPNIISHYTDRATVKYLIYSHDHNDHIGGAYVFADVPNLQVITAKEAAKSLAQDNFAGTLPVTTTFEGRYKMTFGGINIELQTASFHSEDIDVVIYLPQQKFIIAIDTITPGEAPFMNFGATADVGRYIKFFDFILQYDFDNIMSGHVSILGNRNDVIIAQRYTHDVRNSILTKMPSFQERFLKEFDTLQYQNANLAYRFVIEEIRDECAVEMIKKWRTELSVVDVWAASHCETILLYQIMH